MAFITGMLQGLNERRVAERAQNQQRDEKLGDLEIRVLEQLAQGDDDEIAALAGAGILETLSGNNKVTRAKGLRGILGETQRSSFLPGIGSLLASRKSKSLTPGTPGGAALPPTSPVQPQSPQQQAGPPGPPEMSDVARGGLGLPPAPPESISALRPGGGAGPALSGSLGGPPAAPAGLGMAGAPMPQPPEMPDARVRRLYPSANQTAAAAKQAEAVAKYQSMLTGLQMARSSGDPMAVNAVLGSLGAPLPQLKPQLLNIKYLRADGSEGQGLAVVNGDGTADIEGGERVRVLSGSAVNQRPQAPQRIPVADPVTGLVDYLGINADGSEAYRVDSNMQPQAPPSEYNGFREGLGPDGRPAILAMPRTAGEQPRVVAPAVPDRAAGSPGSSAEARTAKGILASYQQAIKEAEAAAPINAMTKKRAPLTDQQRQAIFKRVAPGYQDFKDLNIAAQGGTRSTPPPAPTPPPPGMHGFGTPGGVDLILKQLDAIREGRAPAPPPR